MHAAELGTVDYFRDLAHKLQAAPHGKRGVFVEQAMSYLSMSRQQVYRQLRAVGWRSGRKLRADAGDVSVCDEEVKAVASMMTQARRANGKRLLSVRDAIEIASGNGELSAEISPTSMMRIMRSRGLHPDQVAKPSTHIQLRSEHPNQSWQFDVSVCVLFYLDEGGLAVMDKNRFYKNKPENVRKISKKRVLRYLVTDHYTGSFYVQYFNVAGEDQETLFRFLMEAFARREHAQDPFHGVPFQLFWDAGSANQSHLIKNLLDRLGVRHHAHTPGNPRAKGQVERTHNLVECSFESRLSFMQINSIDQLNEAAQIWSRHFNGTRVHSRHGHTRYGLWQTIRADQLRVCPPRELCESLLRTKPEARQVKGNLVVQYTVRGYEPAFYSVAHVPNVRVGEMVDVCVNPYHAPDIFVIAMDESGEERHYEAKPLGRDAGGFLVAAPIVGREYKATRDTEVDHNRKQMAKDAYDADTQLEVDKARKDKKPAFGGRIDPISYLEAQTAAHYMERRGTEIPIELPREAFEPLSPTKVAVLLARRFQMRLTAEQNQLLHQWYPDGVPESEIDNVVARLREPDTRPSIAIVK